MRFTTVKSYIAFFSVKFMGAAIVANQLLPTIQAHALALGGFSVCEQSHLVS